MSIASNEGDRIPMSQRERDRLRVLHSVVDGQRTQAEAARLLRLTPRQVRRLVQRLQQGGDAAIRLKRFLHYWTMQSKNITESRF
jgi:predicted ArsR family transcriptional regulator